MLATVVLDVFLISHKTKPTKQSQSWFYLKIFQQEQQVPYWDWLFMIASLIGINVSTILLCIFDMKQLVKSGYRVSKNLLALLMWSGGWVASPFLFFTQYLSINGYDPKKFGIFLMRMAMVSISSMAVLFLFGSFLVN